MITISVIDRNKKTFISCEKKENLLQVLRAHGMNIIVHCGGKGICGKCKIKVLSGNIEPSEEDKRFFSEKEISDGYRLACTAYLISDSTIELCVTEEQELVVITDVGTTMTSDKIDKRITEDSYGIAVDVGTTTIAMQIIEKISKNVLTTYTAINPQRPFGADVISRIHAANAGEGKLLLERIISALEKGFEQLLKEAGMQAEKIEEIVISANTTMIHLLLGYPCETLGVSPFAPYKIAFQSIHSKELFPNSNIDSMVKFVPGITTFVGGDIVSGLCYCSILDNEEISLFIDLGTNGEMAIGNKDKILVTSVAAGPAFEGGNISCGVGSIPGAICGVEMDGKKITSITTIYDKEPVGICGTGVIEAIYELVKEELVDETGLLDEELFETGLVFRESDNINIGENNITLTQKDIREIQLAKSAVRSGIEVLLKRYGITCESIHRVYLAGGFGYHMNIEKMTGIGMIPKQLKNKAIAVGNSSLAGAKKLLFNEDAWNDLKTVTSKCEEVNLVLDQDFQSLYMKNIYFL